MIFIALQCQSYHAKSQSVTSCDKPQSCVLATTVVLNIWQDLRVFGSHDNEDVDVGLLSCDAVQTCR
jgi:hypothetical protein